MHDGWACGAPNVGATKDVGATCGSHAECKNDNCISSVPSSSPRCNPPCCSERDCTIGHGLAGNVCAYGSAGNDLVKWCVAPNAGGKDVGATCADKADCKSRYCDAELRRCATVCCTSTDCPVGETCRPSPVGTPFLRCVKAR